MVTAVLLAIFSSLVAALLRGEIEGWSPRASSAIVRLAVRLLAVEKQDRYLEEWSAHLGDMPTPVSKLFASLGFLIAAERLRLTPKQRLIYSFDKVFAFWSLVILTPLMAVVFVALYLELGKFSVRRRVLYRGGKDRAYYRFQTVRDFPDYDPLEGRGPVGQFVWVTNLRDLPLLMNVLKGDLTVFGPHIAGDPGNEMEFAGRESFFGSSSGIWASVKRLIFGKLKFRRRR